MKRNPAILLILLVLAVLGAATVLGQGIKGSKHDLSATSTSSIRSQPVASGGTDEICVFCHTPHGSDAASVGPLWNRSSPTGTYTLYASDYLTSLNYLTVSPAVQPNANSKLCMSCHDGTIALGSVYNLPGSGGYTVPPGVPAATIPMQSSGTAIVGGKMPATVAGYLGADLSNDHPVGFLYNATQDPELVKRAWPWNQPVKLSPDSGNNSTWVSTGTVECRTCHDPHNNQYGFFLRADNTNAALCTFCHNKTNWGAAGHDTSTRAFTPKSTGVATTVGEYACRSCHKPHNGGGTKLLRQAEEVGCYDLGCHGTNNTAAGNTSAANTTQGSLNIQTEMGKVDAHPVGTSAGKHLDKSGGETVTDLNNRHAECPDCHNPHQAQAAVGKSTRGTLRISAALKGAWGVDPTFADLPTVTSNSINFNLPTAYARVSGASLVAEYQVCLKCHSNYVTLPAGARNIAQEINPYASSYHGIVPLPTTIAPTAANGQRSVATNFYVNQNTMVQPWAGNAAYTVAQAETCRNAPASCAAFAASRGAVWCSDCHNSDAAPAYPSTKSATVPSGPHGSNINGTLPAAMAAKIPPAPTGSSNGDKMLIASLTPGATGTPLCVECHLPSVYWSSNTNSRMTRHAADGAVATRSPQACLSCHMWNNPSANIGGDGLIYPHGLNRRWYTLGTQAAGTGTGQMVDAFNGGWYTNMDYTSGARKCWTSSTGNVTPAGATPCNSHVGVSY